MLKFLGRGSGFSDEHNGACFGVGSRLILLDCPLVSFIKLKNKGPEYYAGLTDGKVEEIVIAITHTHSDHIGGLALTVHYARFVWKINVTVIAPSEEVRKDLQYELERLNGCDKDSYRLVTVEKYIRTYNTASVDDRLDPAVLFKADNLKKSCWLKAALPTSHVPELAGRCFGYMISVDGRNVIYTGDTSSLASFIPYLSEGCVLYTECSAYDTGVHIYVDKLLEYKNMLRIKNVEVYLMHLDDIDAISDKIQDSGYRLAPLFDEE